MMRQEMDATAELIVDEHAVHGEGTAWSALENVLYWLNISQKLIYRYDPKTGENESFDVGQQVGCLAPRVDGGLVLGLQNGIAFFDLTTRKVEMVAGVEADIPSNRMNDGKADPAGRFWAGTMACDERSGAGALYRMDLDGTVGKVLSDVTISNGLGWSPDYRLMYYIDSGTQGVDVFDYDFDTGEISRRRRLVTIDKRDGTPDGMTMDADGCLWVAFWGGWCVRRFTPDGTLDREIRVPAARTSCCAFGGPEMTDLYISTACEEIPPAELAEQPHAGGLFRHPTGITGGPTYMYRGVSRTN